MIVSGCCEEQLMTGHTVGVLGRPNLPQQTLIQNDSCLPDVSFDVVPAEVAAESVWTTTPFLVTIAPSLLTCRQTFQICPSVEETVHIELQMESCPMLNERWYCTNIQPRRANPATLLDKNVPSNVEKSPNTGLAFVCPSICG